MWDFSIFNTLVNPEEIQNSECLLQASEVFKGTVFLLILGGGGVGGEGKK